MKVADSDDVTGENGLQHYWHYWSGRRRLNVVGHSCYLGMMPWPIEKIGLGIEWSKVCLK